MASIANSQVQTVSLANGDLKLAVSVYDRNGMGERVKRGKGNKRGKG